MSKKTQLIRVDKKFIKQRDERATLYKANGRNNERLLRDIECELYEYHMIKTGEWEDAKRWEIDGVAPWGTTDVKCIKGYYNINRKKLLHILKQQGITEYFMFIEWNSRPDRLLVAGDKVRFNIIGKVTHQELIKKLQISFKTEGYYFDARKACKN